MSSETNFLPIDQKGHVFTQEPEVVVVISTLAGESFQDYYGLYSCDYCGAYPGNQSLEIQDGKIVAKNACPMAGGITTVSRLKVTSGKIVVSDDLRPVYDWDDLEMASYSIVLGQHQAVKSMEAAGGAYGPVLNTSPTLFQTGPDSYVIANLAWVDYEEGILPEGWKEIARITTDLWAYSVADYGDWVSKGGKPEELGWTDSVVEIPNGIYEFTLHTGEAGFDHYAPGLVVFADVKRLPEEN